MASPQSPKNSETLARLSERLEAGELAWYPQAPFALPQGEDLTFLLEQQMGASAHKNICFNPHNGQVTGYARRDRLQESRLRDLMAQFSLAVTAWLHTVLPEYSAGLLADRASLQPEEEATRRVRHTARNDLLHIDSFPGRPARGRRILRVYANINPRDPRVWVTAEPLHEILPRMREEVEKGEAGWWQQVGTGLLELLRPHWDRRTSSDWFMLRLHDYLKANTEFQQRASRRLWRFPPGSAWLAMTDGCTHGVLRGQFALEHSYFVAPEVLARPEFAPARLLAA